MKENYTREEVDMLLTKYFKDGKDPFVAYDYQLDIAHPILAKSHKRFIINATTRAGKSDILAKTAILFGLAYPNSKIRLIGPRSDQSKILMDYIIDHLSDHKNIVDQLPLSKQQTNRLQLQKQLNKSHIKFNNGSEFMVFSAFGDANRLQGFGGDLIICVTKNTKISTPKGDTKIYKLKEGDEVYSFNIQTNKKELSRIQKVYKSVPSNLYELNLEDKKLRITGNHPVYTKRGWVNVEDLKKDDEIWVEDGDC